MTKKPSVAGRAPFLLFFRPSNGLLERFFYRISSCFLDLIFHLAERAVASRSILSDIVTYMRGSYLCS